MRSQRFEDLLVWQRARVLVREIYVVTRAVHVKRDFQFCAQLQSAAVSIMSNIAEGYERRSRSEFHRFVLISKGSCGEVRSLIYAALDLGYLDVDGFDRLCGLAEETSRMLEGLRKELDAQRR